MLWILKQFGLPILIQAITEMLIASVKNPNSKEAQGLRTYVTMLKTTVDQFLERTAPGANLL